MNVIGVSGAVRPSGVATIQQIIHERLGRDNELVASPSRDRGGRLARLTGLLRGLTPPRKGLDGYFGTVSPLPLAVTKPLVFVVHDLRWVREKSRLKRLYRHLDLARAVHHADMLLCVSHTTRDDLVARFPRAASKARAVWLGPGLVPEDAWSEPVVGRLLLVGAAARKRNELAASMLRHLPDNMVRSATLIGVSEEVRAVCEAALGADHVTFVARASDSEMVDAYAQAQYYVHLGTDEGFGLPFIEALKSGTVVVAVDQPLTREILGGGAVLLRNSDDPADLAAQWQRAEVPTDDVRRAWADKFTWDDFESAVRDGLGLQSRRL